MCTEPYQFIIQRYNPSYNQVFHSYTKHIKTKMPNIGNPIRCVAMKNNGTQCKCVAMIGFNVCGTHRSWEALIGIGSEMTTSYVYQDDAPYVPKNVPTPFIKRGKISDLFEIIGR